MYVLRSCGESLLPTISTNLKKRFVWTMLCFSQRLILDVKTHVYTASRLLNSYDVVVYSFNVVDAWLLLKKREDIASYALAVNT